EVAAGNVAYIEHGRARSVRDVCYADAAACIAAAHIRRTPREPRDSVRDDGGPVHEMGPVDRDKTALGATGMYILVVPGAAKADKDSGRAEKAWSISKQKAREN